MPNTSIRIFEFVFDAVVGWCLNLSRIDNEIVAQAYLEGSRSINADCIQQNNNSNNNTNETKQIKDRSK